MTWPLGTTFVIANDEREIWTVDLQSNVQLGCISYASPFGQFLLHSKRGKRCKYVQPDGVGVEYQILGVDTHGIPTSMEENEDFGIILWPDAETETVETQKEMPDDLSRQLESPIEHVFRIESENTGLKLYPQFSVLQYWADFLIAGTNILIELDGHTYHSSRLQKMRDARRERDLISAGYRVIRFTSDEIFRDVVGCVKEVLKILEALGERNEYNSNESKWMPDKSIRA